MQKLLLLRSASDCAEVLSVWRNCHVGDLCLLVIEHLRALDISSVQQNSRDELARAGPLPNSYKVASPVNS